MTAAPGILETDHAGFRMPPSAWRFSESLMDLPDAVTGPLSCADLTTSGLAVDPAGATHDGGPPPVSDGDDEVGRLEMQLAHSRFISLGYAAAAAVA